MTTQLATAKPQVNIGANKKMIKLALLGKMLSLASNFNASAIVCSNPKIPTVLGPCRRVTCPKICLSSKT